MGAADYLDFQTPGDVQAGGVRLVSLEEGYSVWTKRFGNSPMKVLLLHGGPAGTHEYLECFESFFPQAGIEFYEYDQLGSYYSDQPDDMSLWTVERFVEEVVPRIDDPEAASRPRYSRAASSLAAAARRRIEFAHSVA